MTTFSKWLSDAMYAYGGRKYGGATLARDLGIRRATISEWMTGKAIPRREHIALLARQFGTTSRHIYQMLGIEPPDDLNDILERVNVLAYKLTRDGQAKLLKDLEGGKYGEK